MRLILVLTVALAAGACVAPRSTDSPYGREAVALEPAERDFVLAEMRHFVRAIRGILEGIADNDMKNVAATARAAGLEVYRAQIAGPDGTAASVARKVPPRFRALSLATHEAFDEMALHAQQPDGRDRLLAALADNLNRCVVCHAAYRFPG
jgi:cytochrome c556